MGEGGGGEAIAHHLADKELAKTVHVEHVQRGKEEEGTQRGGGTDNRRD